MAEDLGKADKETLTDQAAAWLVALDAGTADQEMFEIWRRRSPRHAAAFAEVARAWGELDRLRPLRSSGEMPSRPVSRRGLMRGAAAALAVAVVSVTAWPFLDEASAVTAVGERRTIRLPDGVIVELNTSTRVSWRRVGYSREIRLEQGEIGLVVPDDQNFSLVGEPTLRLGAGTYNARLTAGTVEVLGLTGWVQVAGKPVPPGAVAVFEKERLAFRRATISEHAKALAWRRGEVVFAGESLSSVIAEYNRYLERPLVLDDPKLGTIRLGGRFASTDPRPFLKALALGFDLQIRDDGDGPVVIGDRKKANSGSGF